MSENTITLIENGIPVCQMTEIERFSESSDVCVLYELSEPVNIREGIIYEMAKEGMRNRRLEPTAFYGVVSKARFRLK